MAVLTPHDTIVVRLPHPVKIMGIIVHIKRKIGFSFTNMAIYLFRDAMGFKTSKDYQQWVEQHGENKLIGEVLYYSAIAYCQLNKKRENFTKSGLSKAIAVSDPQISVDIMKVWANSETFGLSSKKKLPKAKMK